MPFLTKLDFSDNRQVKQHVETITVLSGGTSFGVPFSALTTGPNLLTTGATNSYFNLVSTFSGNSGTTNYSWFDTRMILAENTLSALTPSNSAITQNSGQVYTANTTTIIDNNSVVLSYTGVSYDISVTGMTDLGGGNYSGTVSTGILNILSANTLDFTGRTIWVDVSGITRTDRLIISRNPQIGYVWTCADTEGMGSWAPASGSSANTNTFTTGGTLIGTTAYFNRNDLLSAYTVNLSALTNYWSASTGTNAIVLKYSDSLASGILSIAEGNQTTASGDYSHAEGSGTTAGGIYSHTEGVSTVVTSGGSISHAEGNSTTASGPISHAEGAQTLASGPVSHAEGIFTVASGTSSHAEGYQTTASGFTAHAEGILSIAGNTGSHAEGGLGTDGERTTVNGLYAHGEGGGTTASADYSHAEGNVTIASGSSAHAEGQFTVAGGDRSHAEGYQTRAINQSSHAEGEFSTASGLASHAEGLLTTANGSFSHAEGSGTTASSNGSHAEGKSTIAKGVASHSEGSATTATSNASHAEGHLTIASGLTSHAEGFGTFAGGINSHAEGNITSALGDGSHSEGANTTASGFLSHAGGLTTIASGTTSFVHGSGSTAGGSNTIVLGADIIGLQSNTTYVDALNIKTVGAGPGVTDLGVDANGNVVDQASDIKLKENINTIENALNKVLSLRGVTYNWKDREKGGNALKLGFIAQEVNNIIPELAYYNSNGDYMGVHYKDVTALLVEAIKELVSGGTTTNNSHLETQTILAEDNNIDLNYSGTPQTAIGGGIRVLHAIDVDKAAEIITDENGDWVTNVDFKPKALTIPTYTPTSSFDLVGTDGNITKDDFYLYVKIKNKWKRTNLENF